jgi:tetratricopeptide (TPR) repeat protein
MIEVELQNAIAAHQRGQLSEAEGLYRKLLKRVPDHFNALHLLGVLKHQQGQNIDAAELISAALRINPNDALVLSNFGAILSELKRYDEALASYDKAITLSARSPRILYNRGTVLQSVNRFDEALACYNAAIELKPDYAEAFNNKAVVLRELGRFNEMLPSLDKAISLNPNYPEAFNNRGNTLRELDRLEEALASYDKAIALKTNYTETLNNRGTVLQELKRFDEALENFDKAIELEPNFAEAFNNRGIALQALQRFDEALMSYDRAIALKPDSPETFNNRGNVLKELNRFDDALADYDKAIALKPGYAEALNNRALGLMELGRLSAARRAAERAIDLVPRTARYYHTLGNVSRFVADDPYVAAMERLAEEAESLSIDDRIELYFALAKAYEDLGELEKSLGQLLQGNALKRRQITYDEDRTLGALTQVQTTFTSEFIRRRPAVGNLSSVPVFIVGMPRSGSTLVEQILASHSEVFGGGELKHFRRAVEDVTRKLGGSAIPPGVMSAMTDQDFRDIGDRYLAELRRLSWSAARITDKMTGNFSMAGLIHLALPNATIIHTFRDPVDTCVSCFSRLFGEGELTYSYDLAELGRYYRHYQALMAHWHQVLPPVAFSMCGTKTW